MSAVVVCGLTDWTARNGPPSWERSIPKPAVWPALSCQLSLTWEDETTAAVRLLGAAGAAGGATTSRVRSSDTAAPTASVMRTWKVLWPRVVGLPVILPVGSIAKPAGKAPPVSASV